MTNPRQVDDILDQAEHGERTPWEKSITGAGTPFGNGMKRWFVPSKA
jgi:alkylated DNA nucleotide flippase Atl1